MGVRAHIFQGVHLCALNLAVDSQFLCQKESLTEVSAGILGIVCLWVVCSFVTSFYLYYAFLFVLCIIICIEHNVHL